MLPDTRARSVLLVEDDADVLEVVRAALLGAGYEVDCARTLGDARRALARHTPELVVSDIRLPDGWGYDLLTDRQASQTKVLFMTGYIEELPSVRFTETNYLVKPISLDALLYAVGAQLYQNGS